MREQKAITLIALVITIIILIILAGVGISIVTGQDGLIEKALKASKDSKKAQYYEEINLVILEEKIERKDTKKEEPLILSIKNKIKDRNWTSEEKISMCKETENGFEQQEVIEENDILLIETNDGYEMIVEVNNITSEIKVREDYFSKVGERLKLTLYLNRDDESFEIKEVRENFKIKLVKPNYIDSEYQFVGWCEDKDGNGQIYLAGTEFKVEKDTKLYAIWQIETVEDLYMGIDNIEETGIYRIDVENGEKYNVHAIVYTGDLNLDGREYEGICTYSDNTYVFGNQGDVAYIDANTSEIIEAQNMLVVKIKGNLSIAKDITIAPYKGNYGGPKGFVLFVEGSFINEGTVSNRTGSYAEGQNLYLWKNKTSNTYEMIEKEGVVGGTGVYAKAGYASRSYKIGTYGTDASELQVSNNKSSGIVRALGAGGAGGVAVNNGEATSSAGADSNSFTAGAGGGAYAILSSKSEEILKAKYCMATDGKVDGNQSSWYASGGSGCPGGKSYIYPNTENGQSEEYCGGLIVIYANEFENRSTGLITVEGGKSGKNTDQNIYSRPGGGSSGGGSVNVFYKEKAILDGTINISGGISYGSFADDYGGKGGDGTYNVGCINTGEYVSLESNI